MPAHPVSRREFLSQSVVAGLTASCLSLTHRTASASTPAGLIAGISHAAIFHGRESGPNWFHPRGCMVPTANGATALMTMQSISGSDVFGHVHWTESRDQGTSWSTPQPIPGLGRRKFGEDEAEGVCEVVPEYHPATRSTLAVGHNVYYRKGVLARPQGPRWPMYTVRNAAGQWAAPQKLVWDDPRGKTIYTCGCGQRVTLDNGDVLIPISYGAQQNQPRNVTVVRARFDGTRLTIADVGNELTNSAGRGLLEPSLTHLDGRYYLTIRAEDQRGYVSSSTDGLNWQPAQPWAWDDGEPLSMSTTQQHWLVHSDALFLVYNRKDASNEKVVRWRSPLYVAEVDRKTLRLLRSTEQIVLPLQGDVAIDPRRVALMGNFHVTTASPEESWVTVGENRYYDKFRGNVLLARITWSKPNRLA
jgi:hypothetical protein